MRPAAVETTTCPTPTTHIQSNGPDYRSVTSFPSAQTVVVIATVGEATPIAASDPAGMVAPHPLDAVRLRVERAVRGEVADEIVVARTGGGGCAVNEDETPLLAGDRVLLFLGPTNARWRGADVYVSWGLDQGVFDIDDGLVTQRTPPHRRPPLEPDRPLDEIVALIEGG